MRLIGSLPLRRGEGRGSKGEAPVGEKVEASTVEFWVNI